MSKKKEKEKAAMSKDPTLRGKTVIEVETCVCPNCGQVHMKRKRRKIGEKGRGK